MSSYSIQVGQIKGLFDIYLNHFVENDTLKFSEYKKLSDTFLKQIVTLDSDYHNSQVYQILSEVNELPIANRLKRLNSKARNKTFDTHYLDWKYIERGIVQEIEDYQAAIKFIDLFEKTKVEFQRIYNEPLVTKIYAEVLQTNLSNLKRMLNQSREVDKRLLKPAEKYLQTLSYV